MNWLSRLFGRIETKQRFTELPAFARWPEARSGISVTPHTALEVAAVHACVRAISEGVAQVPIYFHSRDERGVRGARVAHPLLDVLTRQPNPWQTGFEFRETLLIHLALVGNAYVFVNRMSDGRIKELVPLDPGRVSVTRNRDMSLTYQVTFEDGSSPQLDSEVLWHVRGPSWNTWMGLNAVRVAREAIGLSVALEASHAERHKGGPSITGLLSMKEKISLQKFEELGAWLDRHLPGGERAGKPLILDGEVEYDPMQMSGVDQQHVETRNHQVLEVCRHFRVNPMMVGATETPTYASAEQMFIAHVVHCLTPWAERIEQSATRHLLAADDLIDIRHDFNGLMRGAMDARSNYYAKALGAGGHQPYMTRNEVRAEEGLDPVDGGDEFPAPTDLPAAPAQASGATNGN